MSVSSKTKYLLFLGDPHPVVITHPLILILVLTCECIHLGDKVCGYLLGGCFLKSNELTKVSSYGFGNP